MSIWVKTLGGNTFEVDYNDANGNPMTFLAIKVMLKERNADLCDPKDMRLVFAGENCKDDETLADHNIMQQSVLNLIFRASAPKQILWARTLRGQQYEVDYNDTDGKPMTFRAIKVMLKERNPELCDPKDMRLIVGGKQCGDDETVADYKLAQETVLNLIFPVSTSGPATAIEPCRFSQRSVNIGRGGRLSNVMVYCHHQSPCAEIDEGAGRVHQCKLKLRCLSCRQETILAPNDLETYCTTVDELNRSIAQHMPIEGTECLNPDCRNPKNSGSIYFSCCDCKSGSHDGHNAVLTQVRLANIGETCSICSCEPPPVRQGSAGAFIEFDPCHCHLCFGCFQQSCETTIKGGQGRGSIARSPITGRACFKCPMGHDSFLHDIHHYKILTPGDYLRMKDWVLPDD